MFFVAGSENAETVVVDKAVVILVGRHLRWFTSTLLLIVRVQILINR